MGMRLAKKYEQKRRKLGNGEWGNALISTTGWLVYGMAVLSNLPNPAGLHGVELWWLSPYARSMARSRSSETIDWCWAVKSELERHPLVKVFGKRGTFYKICACLAADVVFKAANVVAVDIVMQHMSLSTTTQPGWGCKSRKMWPLVLLKPTVLSQFIVFFIVLILSFSISAFRPTPFFCLL